MSEIINSYTMKSVATDSERTSILMVQLNSDSPGKNPLNRAMWDHNLTSDKQVVWILQIWMNGR